MNIKRIQFKMIQLLPVAILIFLAGCNQTKMDKVPWVDLFDGSTFNGWNQKGGEAIYTIRDGAIVGTTVYDTPNSFMTTDQMYGDFILELDYKVDTSMNSGIQIRSNSFEVYNNGRVHGYQIEIDPSERAWSAGIYEEGGRAWLVPLTDNIEGQQAFKQNDWNHYRIEAIGDTIKTWINDVPAAHLIDDRTKTGFIGLQVHNIDKEKKYKKDGTEVIWKNIKIITENISKYSKKSALQPITTKNKLTIEEEKDGWQLLWDGKTTNGWRGANLDSFPKSGWEINDGELAVVTTGGKQSEVAGDIVTIEKYNDFELKLDFKMSEGANSGIKYYVNTDLNKGKGSAIGLEYQIIDDEIHPDAKLGNHEGSRTLASVYDLIKANTSNVVNPIGEWNYAHIISKNNHVEHWLNGVKVLEYERKSPEYLKLVSESKYKKWPNFGEAAEGHILLQEHGFHVSFRNIKIRTTND